MQSTEALRAAAEGLIEEMFSLLEQKSPGQNRDYMLYMRGQFDGWMMLEDPKVYRFVIDTARGIIAETKFKLNIPLDEVDRQTIDQTADGLNAEIDRRRAARMKTLQ
jgi:hypothetical protein